MVSTSQTVIKLTVVPLISAKYLKYFYTKYNGNATQVQPTIPGNRRGFHTFFYCVNNESSPYEV